MNNKQNLHIHTNLCDGNDSPIEIVEAALSAGFDSIGFSAHSYMKYSCYLGYRDRTEEYKQEVTKLKKLYEDKLKIFLGLEVDMYSEPDTKDYDYLIGSVHYLVKENEYLGFDRGDEEVERIINEYFGGNGMKYAKLYYETLAQLPDYGKFDIIGHFDIITKHSENRNFFDETSKEYLGYAFDSAEALAGKIPLFEVNTGAIARGYRTTPYPSIPIIKMLKELGFGVVITSDCHDKNKIDCYYDESVELLRNCGFKEKFILTDNGFAETSL